MAIGNYWECVLPEGEDGPPLQRIVGESTTIARQHFSSWRFEPGGQDHGGAEFAFMGFATGDMRAVVHLVQPNGRPNFYLHSAFPWLTSGAPASFTVDQIDTDHFGLEGFIDASLPDKSAVSFFDPLFALNKQKYRIGGGHTFALAAVSGDLGIPASETARITNPETVARMREIERTTTGEIASGHDYVEVDTSRSKILARAADDAWDYYFFHGPVQSIRGATFLDRPFLVFRTAVLDAGSEDLLVDIYVDRGRFRSRPIPTAGDVVSGTLWLQGCLVEGRP